jgi:hypothetical protein
LCFAEATRLVLPTQQDFSPRSHERHEAVSRRPAQSVILSAAKDLSSIAVWRGNGEATWRDERVPVRHSESMETVPVVLENAREIFRCAQDDDCAESAFDAG